MADVKNVLWTGGWDSTFRVIQLYRLGAKIQPIYVIDHNRPSASKELETTERLIKEIPLRFKKDKGGLLPLIIIKRRDIPSNFYLKSVFRRLKRSMNLGKQYYWLASLAKHYNNLEISLHKEDRERFFYENQLTEIKDDELGANWIINPKKVGFLKRQLFKNMNFPLISISKPEMKQIAEDDNFIDLMESTWFCHKSDKTPCGKCNPCKQYIRDGFGYRLE
ncbi:7-cyano-7-deazaguanine synthase [Winogradskyella ursingii]|uniref:7-cyano-7-deazaguanine synthase n=1 Tax=Winogradskyella ursingii TaxID=2686079 RepID=UPI0015CD5A6B|nr:7-cyano-7-deazaguanine synthase [Winogradskyella ursingii]